MTILAGTPTTTPPVNTPETQSPPRVCGRCGSPTRITYIAAGDSVVPGLWVCTLCPEGRHAWPQEADYRCA